MRYIEIDRNYDGDPELNYWDDVTSRDCEEVDISIIPACTRAAWKKAYRAVRLLCKNGFFMYENAEGKIETIKPIAGLTITVTVTA